MCDSHTSEVAKALDTSPIVWVGSTRRPLRYETIRVAPFLASTSVSSMEQPPARTLRAPLPGCVLQFRRHYVLLPFHQTGLLRSLLTGYWFQVSAPRHLLRLALLLHSVYLLSVVRPSRLPRMSRSLLTGSEPRSLLTDFWFQVSALRRLLRLALLLHSVYSMSFQHRLRLRPPGSGTTIETLDSHPTGLKRPPLHSNWACRSVATTLPHHHPNEHSTRRARRRARQGN